MLVGRGSIHRPVVADGDYYERMILYISPACLEALAVDDCDPSECFRLAQQSFQYVYRDGPDAASASCSSPSTRPSSGAATARPC